MGISSNSCPSVFYLRVDAHRNASAAVEDFWQDEIKCKEIRQLVSNDIADAEGFEECLNFVY